MERTHWLRQKSGVALFPDLLWSRPENKRSAGKLLIIGGNGYEFKAPANAYGDAFDAGIGAAKVILPDVLRKTVIDIFPEAEFAPTTPSGSFARSALAQMLDLANWSDGVLMAGDLGRNSETAILLESLLGVYHGQLTLTKDSINYFLDTPNGLLTRPDSLLVVTTAQLQRMATGAGFRLAFTSDMDLLRSVDWLHTFSDRFQAHLIVKHLDSLFVAVGGKVSSTSIKSPSGPWRVHSAAHAAVWWLQNPTKPFEALSTSVAENY